MSQGRGSVHRRPYAVEGESASGAAPTFDGNHTNDVVSWMFANDSWDDELWPETEDQLMQHTAWGHLSWVVFPPRGFRL